MHCWNKKAVSIKTLEFLMVHFCFKPEMGNKHVITNSNKYMVHNYACKNFSQWLSLSGTRTPTRRVK